MEDNDRHEKEQYHFEKGLTGSQKWEVGKILGSVITFGLVVLGAGLYFVVSNIAQSVAANVSEDEIVRNLVESEEFLQRVRTDFGGVPTGAIAAFDIADGCPDGWTDYVDGRGRVIIGATPPGADPGKLTRHEFRKTGGSETHALTIDEMPQHNHNIGANIVQIPYPGPGTDLQAGGAGGNVSPIQGGNKPHNNMPPYIALYLCVKT